MFHILNIFESDISSLHQHRSEYLENNLIEASCKNIIHYQDYNELQLDILLYTSVRKICILD